MTTRTYIATSPAGAVRERRSARDYRYAVSTYHEVLSFHGTHEAARRAAGAAGARVVEVTVKAGHDGRCTAAVPADDARGQELARIVGGAGRCLFRTGHDGGHVARGGYDFKPAG
ncbi:hypothetical protein I5G67_gp095 [Mycobacterium phage Aminay]|uniref:Uncharacterized protein n=1 Tax=Mycobacterium phage Aminay TaxID=2250291 RepID=A0A345KV79_9CAUD|nr:hypothetical protein I5G67_gp095 [Mycobacterium phage Aminay]AXH46931.1 hypothetical protein SEA_AMINAY_95 [Mycobacterium phage Aminay]